MAPWTALNIEPESDNEDIEYDNTKELQIEEALKLYQNALKLHSQGPNYYDQTEQAYKTLFESDIFKYPESQSQLSRLAALNAVDDFEDEAIELSSDIAAIQDVAPSTLPQILYLSLKNRGQFLIDRISYQLRTRQDTPENATASYNSLIESLNLFGEALDKDSSDPDLWRTLSKLGQNAGSSKLARFAIESAILERSQENNTTVEELDLEGLVLQLELQNVLFDIDRETTTGIEIEQQPLVERLVAAFEPLRVALKKPSSKVLDGLPIIQEKALKIENLTWQAIGEAILEAREEELDEHDHKLTTYSLSSTQMVASAVTSPTLVTSESFSKRRFSKNPVTPYKSLQHNNNAHHNTSPVLRTKNIGVASSGGNVETSESTTEGLAATLPATEPRVPAKRNSESAGLQDTPDAGTRSRSKRLRARAETMAEETPDPKALHKQYEEALGVYSRADDWAFNVAYEIGCRFGSKWVDSAETVREAVATNVSNIASTTDPSKAPLFDFRNLLAAWNSNRSKLLLDGTGIGASAVLIDDGSDASFSSFMERSKPNTKRSGRAMTVLTNQRIHELTQALGSNSYSLEELALDWVTALLLPQDNLESEITSLYTEHIWTDELKDIIEQCLAEFDEYLFSYVSKPDHVFDQEADSPDFSPFTAAVLAQTIFEIHLDIFSKMVAQDSKTDQPSRASQRNRMTRWATLSNSVMNKFQAHKVSNKSATSLTFRHLWAEVVFIGLVEASAREHILMCYQDLQRMFELEDSPAYSLPNNSVMPEVSLDALEQELSKEKTMDFFQSIFGAKAQDPVTLIENLEPILMQTFGKSEALSVPKQTGRASSVAIEDSEEEESLLPEDPRSRSQTEGKISQEDPQLVEFIQKANVQLKLSLWHQLKGAYNRIDYPGMKIVCNFRSIILILREIHGFAFAQEVPEDRAGNLIIWIRNLADLVSQTLDTIRTHAKALDCLAEENLELAIEACSFAIRLFHVFALWEDSVRIGQIQAPSAPGNANQYKNAMTFLRETYSKTWHLLYLIYREAFSQDITLEKAASEDLIELIKAMHCSFGNREYCGVGRKVLMKFMKSELLRLDGPEEEVAQALYDLYGLKITQNPNSIWEHGCTGDTIDRTSALELVEHVTNQAISMNMRDLLKSDIRTAIEKMQAVIGIPRAVASTTHQGFNRKLIDSYLKALVLGAQMQRALKGVEGISTMSIKTDYASVASKRWFFLVGSIHLAKYKSSKRVSPDNAEDLDQAVNFLRLDLDFDASSWETWLRLGQAYDAKLDEEVLWDATVINEKPEELTEYERYAIHCYEMAISLAKQTADDTRETQLKLADLYSDFATRLYSSTREPFNGRVFDLSTHRKWINQPHSGTYLVDAHQSLSLTAVWRLCERLYQRALDEKHEDDWFIWYMRGKCRWKLFCHDTTQSIHWDSALQAFQKAVEQVPEKRDNKHPDKEPVLEPHYKLLATVYKLLNQGAMSPREGFGVLSLSQYAKKVQHDDPDDWKSYTLEFLQVLRNADKSNWHHRMIAKTAHIAYDERHDTLAAAQAAKDKFSQHILTKALAIQIWKPEYERPGRHFVYTSRYVRFIIKLLEQLGERPVLETLGKRVRKKQNEYIDPADIFDQICEAHMRLVRVQGGIAEKSEERVFHHGMTFEHFVLNAGRLETWAHSQLSLTNTKLPLLTEIWELKRLSGSLLEKGPFEELMMDIYACLFESVVPDLITRAGEAENREKMRIDRMLMKDDDQSAQASAAETTTAPSRPRQISKTEVRRRAEALVAKTVVPTVKAKASNAREASPEAKSKEAPSKVKKTVPGPMEINDSGDDAESELSSVADSDEEALGPSPAPVKASMFPKLAKRDDSVDTVMEDART